MVQVGSQQYMRTFKIEFLSYFNLAKSRHG